VAGFKSERVAGFKSECMAGFVGIRSQLADRWVNQAIWANQAI